MTNINKYKLINDFHKVIKDFNEIVSHKKFQSRNKVKKFADDIKKLNENLYLNSKNETAALIYHFLSTPFGAPFVTNKTLLEAAINFENQKFKTSDLRHMFAKLKRSEKFFNNEISKIFKSLNEHLKEEK